ncbi:MBL fold metallo-hydrolase [Bacillus sp. FJAT-49705]|uniref:MBL fold metallo-hydrolase n=1 Tax=Cytobacillus citreus TaxID=2833586 RepID=A0ABS5NRM9_9BACI|nr:MBL fold metallo-hydrolase [Cytobacillus citreus]MBS4190460.1 MBL fold metallo-hydrolase [Cytobacillus citreus]
MLFHKKLERGNVGDIHFANGSIQFQSVKLNVYSYATDGIVIDAGSKSFAKQFQAFFDEQQIDALYCTHIHEDHTGCAAWLQDQRKVPVYIHKNSIAEALKKGKYPLYRQLFWGIRPPFNPLPVPETFHSRTFNWQSIFTPGHSADHIAYLNTSTGQLFSGDLFVQVKTKVIMDSESIPQIIESIEHILTYDFKEVFCNHAGYIKDGKEKLQEKLDYLYHVTDEVKKLYQQGMSVQEIQQHFFPRKYQITTFSLGQWDSKHIVTSILG